MQLLLQVQIQKNTKKTDGLTVHFALLGSALKKALHKTLMKLIPWRRGERGVIAECRAMVTRAGYFFIVHYPQGFLSTRTTN